MPYLPIKEAKKNLYGLLLSLSNPTDAEINIMYELSMDSDIREILEESINNE